MNKQLVRDWAEQKGVSRRIRHLAYNWIEDYSSMLLGTDNSRVLVRAAKNGLKDLRQKETDRDVRRTLKYELRFLRWFWKTVNRCDCCDCSGCYLSSPDVSQ